MRERNLSRLALGGIVGSFLFTIIMLVCSAFRPGYNHVSQFISELGATGTANAVLLNYAAFIPSGILIVFFGIAAMGLFPKKATTIIGSCLLIVFGLGVITAGFFSCDPGCPRQGTLANNIHDQMSGPAFLSGVTGILLFGISFRKLPAWKNLWRFSVITALLSYGFIVMLVLSLDAYTTTGLWQRLLLGAIFIWLSIVSIRLHSGRKE
jgi:hypothetical membrane protein